MTFSPSTFAALALACATVLATPARATTQLVSFNTLNASTTLASPFLAGDVLRLNTYTSQVGALLQSVTFSVAAGVASLGGQASWEIDTATGSGPRLIGVNIDVFDASNALVVSDSGVLTANGFATSVFAATALGPGTYRMVATGTGVRDSSLDVTLRFAAAVPEPGTYGLMLAGLAAVALVAKRRVPR
jgi:hypothetical protein